MDPRRIMAFIDVARQRVGKDMTAEIMLYWCGLEPPKLHTLVFYKTEIYDNHKDDWQLLYTVQTADISDTNIQRYIREFIEQIVRENEYPYGPGGGDELADDNMRIYFDDGWFYEDYGWDDGPRRVVHIDEMTEEMISNGSIESLTGTDCEYGFRIDN